MTAFKRIPSDLDRVANFGGKGQPVPSVKPGAPYKLKPLANDLLHVCCDCGHTSRMRFNVRGEWLIIRAIRE